MVVFSKKLLRNLRTKGELLFIQSQDKNEAFTKLLWKVGASVFMNYAAERYSLPFFFFVFWQPGVCRFYISPRRGKGGDSALIYMNQKTHNPTTLFKRIKS